jgi:hypothetical protein
LLRRRAAELATRGHDGHAEEAGTWLRCRTYLAAAVDLTRAEKREVDASVLAMEQAMGRCGRDGRREYRKEEQTTSGQGEGRLTREVEASGSSSWGTRGSEVERGAGLSGAEGGRLGLVGGPTQKREEDHGLLQKGLAAGRWTAIVPRVAGGLVRVC